MNLEKELEMYRETKRDFSDDNLFFYFFKIL